jgi:hypothetical protein
MVTLFKLLGNVREKLHPVPTHDEFPLGFSMDTNGYRLYCNDKTLALVTKPGTIIYHVHLGDAHPLDTPNLQGNDNIVAKAIIRFVQEEWDERRKRLRDEEGVVELWKLKGRLDDVLQILRPDNHEKFSIKLRLQDEEPKLIIRFNEKD